MKVCSLWTAKLFPVFTTRKSSSEYAISMVNCLKSGVQPDNLGKCMLVISVWEIKLMYGQYVSSQWERGPLMQSKKMDLYFFLCAKFWHFHVMYILPSVNQYRAKWATEIVSWLFRATYITRISLHVHFQYFVVEICTVLHSKRVDFEYAVLSAAYTDKSCMSRILIWYSVVSRIGLCTSEIMGCT